jgi:hypothetical protein
LVSHSQGEEFDLVNYHDIIPIQLLEDPALTLDDKPISYFVGHLRPLRIGDINIVESELASERIPHLFTIEIVETGFHKLYMT